MIRGATAQFTFELPKGLKISDISHIQIAAWQKGYKGTPAAPLPIIREYTNTNWDSNIIEDEHTLVVKFTSADTLRFTDKLKGYIQCKVVVIGDAVYPTLEQRFTVYPMYDDLIDKELDGEIRVDEEGWIILDGQTISN